MIIYTNKNGKQIFLTEKEMGKIYRFIQSLHKKANTVGEGKLLKGFSASPGYAKGVAKVVLSSKDFHKLHAGEILITTMTSVDFVPVMERAAAFVTNEGGITSHAAIVAREMNKPCIIGTRIATKVLKDGDLVEVDAFRGIVKKIK